MVVVVAETPRGRENGTENNCPITDYRVILATELNKQHT